METEIVELFSRQEPGWLIDATLGGAGHTTSLLKANPNLKVLGIDRDPIARQAAREKLSKSGISEDRYKVAEGTFGDLENLLDQHSFTEPIQGALFDFGVSSPQLDWPERGFSFRHDGPLDMRMNPKDTLTAEQIVNEYEVEEIAKLLRDGADERFAFRIAKAIVKTRPHKSTTALAQVITEAIPAATRRSGGHPAKRSFQALRIAVNNEIAQIPSALTTAISALNAKGRIAVLSYHSGEDALVKAAFDQAASGGCECPSRLPCVCAAKPQLKILRPKLRRPTEAEIDRNPRSASARLRCAERLFDENSTA